MNREDLYTYAFIYQQDWLSEHRTYLHQNIDQTRAPWDLTCIHQTLKQPLPLTRMPERMTQQTCDALRSEGIHPHAPKFHQNLLIHSSLSWQSECSIRHTNAPRASDSNKANLHNYTTPQDDNTMPILTAWLITTQLSSLRCLLPLHWQFSCGFHFMLFIIVQMLNFVLQHHCVCQVIPIRARLHPTG